MKIFAQVDVVAVTCTMVGMTNFDYRPQTGNFAEVPWFASPTQ